MIIAKWGNSLAVRLPAVLVQALSLQEGDAVSLQPVGDKQFKVERREPKLSFADCFVDLRSLLVTSNEEEALPTLPRTNRPNDFTAMLDDSNVM